MLNDNDANDAFQSLHEIVKAAKARLGNAEWDYLMGGAGTEATVKRNRLSIDSLSLRQRVLTGTTQTDCRIRLFGQNIRMPILLAPIGSLESFDPAGSISAANGAAAFGVPLILGSQARPALEECVAAVPNVPLIYQLYVRGDNTFEDEQVRRAVDAGCKALCITVDSSFYGNRDRDIIRRFVKPWRQRSSGFDFQARYNWDNVRRFKDNHDIPLMLKGITSPEDAETAVDLGVDCIYVSNHGGRQLDHAAGAIDCLPDIVQAVSGRATIVIDGGFMRGTDIVKAICLGADAVAIGRLFGIALTSGERGVVRMLELLEVEIALTLGLLGVQSPNNLDSSRIQRGYPVEQPHGLSAFPLLQEGY